mmetsp:Transcript_63221/g.186889  ORF Transcript_63221/g.186889 Transcript_63221/m.186889 type:complete len:99 (-) Transcript_63221:37-333(-)
MSAERSTLTIALGQVKVFQKKMMPPSQRGERAGSLVFSRRTEQILEGNVASALYLFDPRGDMRQVPSLLSWDRGLNRCVFCLVAFFRQMDAVLQQRCD